MAELYLIDSENNLTPLSQSDYDSEELLQTLLADHPQLLGGDQMGAGVARQWLFVTREAAVPDRDGGGGRWSLDHLFLDQDAIPTFVEVKRATDNRIRREVVGQMLDYAANGLRYWPVEQIQAFLANRVGDVDSALGDAFGESVDTAAYWQRLGENIAEGRVRLLFVADRIPDELLAVVEFLNRQMDHTEVLAVEVPQFIGEGLRTLAPRVLGMTQEAIQKKRQVRTRRSARPEFQALIEQYDAVADDDLVTNGSASGYRQVKVLGWPSALHYEFLDRGGEPLTVGIEIHLESAEYPQVKQLIEELARELVSDFADIGYSRRWMNGCRLSTFVPMAEPGDAIIVMKRLISATRSRLDALVCSAPVDTFE